MTNVYTTMPGEDKSLCCTAGGDDLERPSACGMVTGLATELPLACLASKGVECTGGTEGWISPTEPRVPLLGHFTGAGTWVGCCVLGAAGEADFLLT